MADSSRASRQIARAAVTVMAAFVLSSLMGLIRQILISRAFGTSAAVDAFNAASTFPDLIFNLVAGGALASAFVPTFSGLLAKEQQKTAWELASSLLNLIVIILIVLSVVSFPFAGAIVRHILAPDFSTEQQELTASLLQILLLCPTIFGISGLFMGILNSHQIFLYPALAPSMYGLGIIIGVIAFTPTLGVHGLAWGAVLGALLHLLVQLPAIRSLPGRAYSFTVQLTSPYVREVARLMAPRLLGVAIVQLNFVVNTVIASGQPEGSLTAIKMAWIVMYMPQAAIAQAIAIASLPTFSAQVARNEMEQMRSTLVSTLRGVLFLAIPSSIGLIVMRHEVVAMLFQRGAFSSHSTQLVAWALLWYAAGLIGHCVVEIVSRAFYALHDTKTPVGVGVAAMSLNVGFSLLFSYLFELLGWFPHGGLALANSLATALEMVGLLWIMRRRLKGLELGRLAKGVIQAIIAALGMALLIEAWLLLTNGQPIWIVGLGGLAAGAIGYAILLLMLRVPEAYALLSAAKHRLPLPMWK